MRKSRIHFPDKKTNTGYRLNIYFVIWTLIIIGSVYLLLRFAAISFAEEIGQAKVSYSQAFLYYLGDKVLESGPSFISYVQSDQDAEPFTYLLMSHPFAVGRFTDEKSHLMAKAQEYSLNEDYVILNPQDQKATESTAADAAYQAMADTAQDDKNYSTSLVLPNIKLYALDLSILSKEYILTNGAIYNEQASNYFNSELNIDQASKNELEVGSASGELPVLEKEDEKTVEASSPGNVIDYTLEQLKDVNFLIRHFYIVDPSTKVTEDLFNAEKLLGMDMKLKQKNDAPQILIYHTHSQETYVDSRENESEDTVVGVGSYLTKILEDRYHYKVIHDTTTYDIVDGKLDRNKAYNVAKDGITRILEENPTIEVVIDLHRDGADKRSTIINGEETAQVMLFNGLSRDENGPITYLDNPNLQDNIAFSLQMQLKAVKLYPGLFYKNYLKCWRYNMHVRPKSLLMELGTYKNTLQSAKNAMEPFAEVLNAVLQGQ